MFRSSTFFSTLLLALLFNEALAAPSAPIRGPSVATLPITTQFRNGTAKAIVEADRARIAQIKKDGAARLLAKEAATPEKRASYSFTVTNAAVTYLASVGVGSPATQYSLIIDTGSSNTWVGAGKAYVKTSTSVNTGKSVSVSYGSGSFSGTEYTDTVTLSSNLVITKQSIGVASSSSGFSGEDGILGIGPVDLTQGTVSGVSSVPTVTDNLFSQGTISGNSVGIFFAPTTVQSTANGELTFGGPDATKYTGTLSYVPVTSTYPASYYWGIDQSIKYGSTTILSTTAGITDTGTTLIYLATDAYNRYKTAVGATLDSTTGLLRISSSKYSSLSNLVFTIGSGTYTLTPNGQIWPRSLNAYIGGSSSYVYLVVNDVGSNSGSGLDFIDGYTFLERFYTVYDTTNKRIGFATTAYTTATTN